MEVPSLPLPPKKSLLKHYKAMKQNYQLQGESQHYKLLSKTIW